MRCVGISERQNCAKLWIATIVALALLAPLSAAAYQDNFNDGSDGGWTHYDPLGHAGYASPATYAFPGGDTYEITAGVSAYPQAAGPSRAGSYLTQQSYANFNESVQIVGWSNGPAGSNESIGLLARLSNPGLGTSDAYSLTYSTGGHDLVLDIITNESPAFTPLARVTVGDLPEGGVYDLVFTGNGPTLTGYLYNDANPVSPRLLDEISATDSTYSSGYPGLIVFDDTDTSSGSNGADATFDNFSVVPEPRPVGVVAMCFLLLIGGRRPSYLSPRP